MKGDSLVGSRFPLNLIDIRSLHSTLRFHFIFEFIHVSNLDIYQIHIVIIIVIVSHNYLLSNRQSPYYENGRFDKFVSSVVWVMGMDFIFFVFLSFFYFSFFNMYAGVWDGNYHFCGCGVCSTKTPKIENFGMLGTTEGRRFLAPSGSQTHHQTSSSLTHLQHPFPYPPYLWPGSPTLSSTTGPLATPTSATAGRLSAFDFQANGEGELPFSFFVFNFLFQFSVLLLPNLAFSVRFVSFLT